MKQENLKVKGWTLLLTLMWNEDVCSCCWFHLLVHERWRLNMYCWCFDLGVGLDATDVPSPGTTLGYWAPASIHSPSMGWWELFYQHLTAQHSLNASLLHNFLSALQWLHRLSGNSSILPNTITSISTCLSQPCTKRGIYSLWPPDQQINTMVHEEGFVTPQYRYHFQH